jgi:hypothetical protein
MTFPHPDVDLSQEHILFLSTISCMADAGDNTRTNLEPETSIAWRSGWWRRWTCARQTIDDITSFCTNGALLGNIVTATAYFWLAVQTAADRIAGHVGVLFELTERYVVVIQNNLHFTTNDNINLSLSERVLVG